MERFNKPSAGRREHIHRNSSFVHSRCRIQVPAPKARHTQLHMHRYIHSTLTPKTQNT